MRAQGKGNGCDAMFMALNRGVDATDDWLLPSVDCHLFVVLESGNSVTVVKLGLLNKSGLEFGSRAKSSRMSLQVGKET
ncbi:hypothetical protein Ccrd_009871 [Cynara cardunculus var. scolymus]|uniref:Uncharacterized protein n=1 Tax=Cynara cardunculus var. scolymus TaxID=59895 RepID=A0A103YMB2_CYNCS|nr:hypothetical protein Ccrd_009871 [Cynara cardunculus var. scolymus]